MPGKQRHLFDIPRDICYLNSAYMGPRLHSVTKAGRAAVETGRAPWSLTSADFFETADHIRRVFAGLIGSGEESIAIVPSVSYAMAVAAANIELKPGDEIVLLEEQFPSNVYPWQRLAAECGATIRTVSRPKDCDWTTAVLSNISARTALAALPQVHWTDGSRIDLEVVGRRCRDVGSALVLDLTQSLGAAPFSITEVKPDFMVAAAYKWLLGPYGVTYLYVSPARQDGVPIEQTWMGRYGSEDFSSLVSYQDAYRDGARRFDAGQHCSFILLPMALEGLRQIASWTPDETASTLREITDLIASRAGALGFDATPSSARSPHMLGLSYPDSVPSGLLDALAAERVYASVRGRRIRVAPHLHVDDEDIERFFAVLADFAP
ncbi:MAG: aminotransferase class V-fold PLP-dependent enzyme [Gammaproteobacteria bacterium]|nr:aminotransferase class V-fold PLP-dependent enzyme [Gammaproteobacteria bacterium]